MPIGLLFFTEIGVFVPGGRAASLRGWSPSQGECYDHVASVPTSGCSVEIGRERDTERERQRERESEGERKREQHSHRSRKKRHKDTKQR